MPLHPLWLTLGLVVSLAIVGWVVLTRRREHASLRDLARRSGLNFSPEDLIGLHDRYNSLELIRTGHSRHVWNVIYGMTPAGPLSVFSYAFELGFGLRRTRQKWWIAVLELEAAQEAWQATSESEGSDALPERSAQVGPFALRAEHEGTLQQLREKGVNEVLTSAPGQARFEVRGQLAAVAVPAESAPADREQLLKTAMDLGSFCVATSVPAGR